MGGWVDEYFDIFDIYLNHLSPLQGYFIFSFQTNQIVRKRCADVNYEFISEQSTEDQKRRKLRCYLLHFFLQSSKRYRDVFTQLVFSRLVVEKVT